MASFLEQALSILQKVEVKDLIDFNQPSLYLSIGSIIFNPTVWNIVARNEYKRKTLTNRLGSPLKACYLMAVTIVAFGFLRDGLYKHALGAQPQTIPDHPYLKPTAVLLFGIGQILVLSSTWALGVTGTYLGDYCGILQDKMVTGFPFNVQTDPMYNGSTLCFLATALWFRRPAGIFVTAIVWVVYRIALRFEGPFTSKIYAAREAKLAKSSSDSTSTSTPAAPKSLVAPSTPAKSSTTPVKSFAPAPFKPANTETESYADAIKISAATPKKSAGVTSATEGGGGTGQTPGRMTRSRSKVRGSEDEL
ncbi:phospholipid methyltransferase-domain-containing protein [Mrakia frigida]|uniref:bifunctional phosphatidyl-N-methylethanolamine N-methyltransferase/phosphatidyl-N-dimethylethanolamine N-methyltransferase n=1 Tax=Mrakia frigida TaxID=29902 RepID=UPI003FCBFA63